MINFLFLYRLFLPDLIFKLLTSENLINTCKGTTFPSLLPNFLTSLVEGGKK